MVLTSFFFLMSSPAGHICKIFAGCALSRKKLRVFAFLHTFAEIIAFTPLKRRAIKLAHCWKRILTNFTFTTFPVINSTVSTNMCSCYSIVTAIISFAWPGTRRKELWRIVISITPPRAGWKRVTGNSKHTSACSIVRQCSRFPDIIFFALSSFQQTIFIADHPIFCVWFCRQVLQTIF